jgi:excisionase family DNA binding protein
METRIKEPERGDSSHATVERLTYTVDEVAAILGLSRSKTYDLVAQGHIPTVPLAGRRRLIARQTLQRLLRGEPLRS